LAASASGISLRIGEAGMARPRGEISGRMMRSFYGHPARAGVGLELSG
jgi:hypothetical protein